MSSNFIFFVKTPDLNKLVTLILDVTATDGDSHISWYHRRILKCRELLFSIPQLLATPELNRKRHILAIVPKYLFGSTEFRSRIAKIGFKVISVVNVTDDVLQECFHYTSIAKMAPNWNLVGDMLIQGRDFLLEVGPMNAVKLEVIVAKEEMHLNLHAFSIKMPNLKLEYYQRSFHYQEWEAEGNISKPLTVPLSEECHVLPSLKQATLLSITNHIPKDSCFADYKEFKKHWKNMYGYRLPDMPPEEIWYCNVAFRCFRKTIYAYPMLCVRPFEPSIMPRTDPQGILRSFLEDFHRKIGTVCGQSCQLVEMRPAFLDIKLYPANQLKEDMKPRCGTTYDAPNEKVPYRKNTTQNLRVEPASCSRPYYTPKPLNLLKFCTPQSNQINVLSQKQGMALPLTSEMAQSLTKFNKAPPKSYKSFENLSQSSRSFEASAKNENAFSSSGLTTIRPFNEPLPNDFKHEKLRYQPRQQQNLGLYADNYSQCNSTSLADYNTSSNYLAQNSNHPKSKEIEALESSPFYPLQTFVQMSQVSPQIFQEHRPSSQTLTIQPVRNIFPENKYFSPLANETSPDETENAEVYKFIMSNKMAAQALPNCWLNVSSHNAPENFLTPSEGSPVSTECTHLAIRSPLRNPNRPLLQREPFSSIENFSKKPSSSDTEMSGTSFATNKLKSSSMHPTNQISLICENLNFASGNAMNQVLTPTKSPDYSDKQKLSAQYCIKKNNNRNSTKIPFKQDATKGEKYASESPWFSGVSQEQRFSLSLKKPKRMKSSEKACKKKIPTSSIQSPYLSQTGSESIIKTNLVIGDKEFMFHDKLESSILSSKLISTPSHNDCMDTPSQNLIPISELSDLLPETSLSNCTNNAPLNGYLVNNPSRNKLPSSATFHGEKKISLNLERQNSIKNSQNQQLSVDYKVNRSSTPLDQAEHFQKLDLSLRNDDDTVAVELMHLDHSTTIVHKKDIIMHIEQQTPISTQYYPTNNDSSKEEKLENTPIKLTPQKYELDKSSIGLDTEKDFLINKNDKFTETDNSGKKSIRRKGSSTKVSKASTKSKKLLPDLSQPLMDKYVKKSAPTDSSVLKSNSLTQEMPKFSETPDIYAQQSMPSLYAINQGEKIASSTKAENMEYGDKVLSNSLIPPLLEKRKPNSILSSASSLTLASNRHIMAARIAEQSSSQPAKVIPQFFKKFGKAQNNLQKSMPVPQTSKCIPTFFSKKKASTQPISNNEKAPFPDALLAVKVTRGIPKASKVKSAGKRKKPGNI